MQTVSRYLINNLVIGYINGYHGRNSKVYDKRLRIFRGVNNPITFTFKNEDQKRQDVTSKTFEFNIIDTESKKSVLTRNLTILDDGSTLSTKGNADVTITEGDMLLLEAKFYNFSVREVASDNSRTVTYSDTSYNSAGTIELIEGAYPDFVPTTTVQSFTATGGPLQHTSSAIDAKPGENNNQALHTVAIYSKNFSGRVKIQGTLDSTVVLSESEFTYFDIASVDITSNQPLVYANFTGVFQNVRFSWDTNAGNSGLVDRILYRH